MRKRLLASLAIAGLAGSVLAASANAAPNYETTVPTVAQIQAIQQKQAALLDAHLAAMKAGLKLTDEQARNWPAFEAAIRDAAKARWDRWTQARDRMAEGERPSPIDRMTIMADHIEKSAAELRKVIEASKPLYASLDDAQKREFGPLMREFKPTHRR